MSLPKKYDERIRKNLGLRAVWLPGTNIKLGDVLWLKDGIFVPITNLRKLKVNFESEKLSDNISLKFQARGVSSSILQGGAKIKPINIDLKADAELEIQFNREDTYFVRTPKITGYTITNILTVAQNIIKIPDWNNKRNFIAWNVYKAGKFIFLGNEGGNATVRVQGTGKAILDFLKVGVSAKVARVTSSNTNIELIGERGPVAMRVIRVRKNGDIY